MSRDEKLQRLYDNILGIAGGLIADRDVAVIEGYAFGSKYQRETMGEVSGLIRLVLIQTGIPCTAIAPASWQKQLLGRKVAKDLREELLLTKYVSHWPAGVFPETLDETEAWALAFARWERYTGAYIVPPYPPKKSKVKAKRGVLE
jgi:hypothetical protein